MDAGWEFIDTGTLSVLFFSVSFFYDGLFRVAYRPRS